MSDPHDEVRPGEEQGQADPGQAVDPASDPAPDPSALERENAELRQQLAQERANNQALVAAGSAPNVVGEVLPPEKHVPSNDELMGWMLALMIKNYRANWPDDWAFPGSGEG